MLSSLLKVPAIEPRMTNKEIREQLANDVYTLTAKLNQAINAAGAMGLEVELTTSTNPIHFLRVNVK